MIVPDLNLLIYAYDSASPHQEPAAKWWTGCLQGAESIGLTWVVVLGFLRLWTNLATTHVESWLERRSVRLIHPGANHAKLLFDFLRREGKGGNLTTGAPIWPRSLSKIAPHCTPPILTFCASKGCAGSIRSNSGVLALA